MESVASEDSLWLVKDLLTCVENICVSVEEEGSGRQKRLEKQRERSIITVTRGAGPHNE